MSGSILALSQMPFQWSWAEELQQIELEREVAGTSRIEGAEFADKELDAALRETLEQLVSLLRTIPPWFLRIIPPPGFVAGMFLSNVRS